MSTASGRKTCIVAFALPERQFLWRVELPVAASVAQVLEEAERLARREGAAAAVPWHAETIGIFGEPCSRRDIPRDGDRIEIYRPLPHDPRDRRRERVRRGR